MRVSKGIVKFFTSRRPVEPQQKICATAEVAPAELTDELAAELSHTVRRNQELSEGLAFSFRLRYDATVSVGHELHP